MWTGKRGGGGSNVHQYTDLDRSLNKHLHDTQERYDLVINDYTLESLYRKETIIQTVTKTVTKETGRQRTLLLLCHVSEVGLTPSVLHSFFIWKVQKSATLSPNKQWYRISPYTTDDETVNRCSGYTRLEVDRETEVGVGENRRGENKPR